MIVVDCTVEHSGELDRQGIARAEIWQAVCPEGDSGPAAPQVTRVNGPEQVTPNCARRVERRSRRLQRAKELATCGIGVAVMILVAGVDYTGWRALKAKRPRAGQ